MGYPSTIFEEGLLMSESTVPARSGGDYDRFIGFLKNLALVVTIVGAVPTAITAYHAYTFGVPFSQVPQRLAQYDLWVKNIDCQIEYKALATAEGTRVDVGACSKTGDIALKLSSADGKAAYQWIAYNELQKPGEAPEVNKHHRHADLGRPRRRSCAPVLQGRARLGSGLPVHPGQERGSRRQGRRQMLQGNFLADQRRG